MLTHEATHSTGILNIDTICVHFSHILPLLIHLLSFIFHHIFSLSFTLFCIFFYLTPFTSCTPFPFLSQPSCLPSSSTSSFVFLLRLHFLAFLFSFYISLPSSSTVFSFLLSLSFCVLTCITASSRSASFNQQPDIITRGNGCNM